MALKETAKSKVSSLKEAAVEKSKGFFSRMKDKAASLKETVKSKVSSLKDASGKKSKGKGFFSRMKDKAASLKDAAVSKISTGAKYVGSKAVGAAKYVGSTAVGAAKAVGSGAKAVGSAAVGAAKGAAKAVGSGAKAVGSAAVSTAKAVGSGAKYVGSKAIEPLKKKAIKALKKFSKKLGGSGGKSILKRIPILGTMVEGIFAHGDIKEIINDPEKSKKEKNKAVGTRFLQGLGGPTGAAIGVALANLVPGGVFASLLAAAGGDWVGRFVAGKLANILPAEAIGKSITNTFYKDDSESTDKETAQKVLKTRTVKTRSWSESVAVGDTAVSKVSSSLPELRPNLNTSSSNISVDKPTTGVNMQSKIAENSIISGINREARSAVQSGPTIMKGGDSNQVNNTTINNNQAHVDRTMDYLLPAGI